MWGGDRVSKKLLEKNEGTRERGTDWATGNVKDQETEWVHDQLRATVPSTARVCGEFRLKDEVIRSQHWPERLAVDADFFEDVFEELWRALLYDMVDPQTGLQILHETSQETNKVFCCANGARDRLWEGRREGWKSNIVKLFEDWVSCFWKRCNEKMQNKSKNQIHFVLMSYLEEFHLVTQDLPGRRQFPWRHSPPSVPPPVACTPPSV